MREKESLKSLVGLCSDDCLVRNRGEGHEQIEFVSDSSPERVLLVVTLFVRPIVCLFVRLFVENENKCHCRQLTTTSPYIYLPLSTLTLTLFNPQPLLPFIQPFIHTLIPSSLPSFIYSTPLLWYRSIQFDLGLFPVWIKRFLSLSLSLLFYYLQTTFLDTMFTLDLFSSNERKLRLAICELQLAGCFKLYFWPLSLSLSLDNQPHLSICGSTQTILCLAALQGTQTQQTAANSSDQAT